MAGLRLPARESDEPERLWPGISNSGITRIPDHARMRSGRESRPAYRTPRRTPCLELGEWLALDAESLVVGEMPVEDVHLHGGHAVEIAFERVHWDEVAADVNQEAAPRKTR